VNRKARILLQKIPDNPPTENSSAFSVDCRRCVRLAGFLDEVKNRYPDYYARPVPPFGDEAPKLLIIGLAPGMHGANRTGRPFTGDFAGILLYRTLHKFGFANHEGSASPDDNLQLMQCRITNAVKCLPPPKTNRFHPKSVSVTTIFPGKLKLSDGKEEEACSPWAPSPIRLSSWPWA
jgi:uracil-DNA glycosylase